MEAEMSTGLLREHDSSNSRALHRYKMNSVPTSLQKTVAQDPERLNPSNIGIEPKNLLHPGLRKAPKP